MKKPAVKKKKSISPKQKPVRASVEARTVIKPIGTVTHFYGHIKVAIVKFSKPIVRGTSVHFVGATTDFSQKLTSMQFDHKDITKAPKGKEIGIKVHKRVREGDSVFEA